MTTHYRYRIELATTSNARPVRTYTPWRPGQVAALHDVDAAAPDAMYPGGWLSPVFLRRNRGGVEPFAVAHLEEKRDVESECLTSTVKHGESHATA